MADRLSEDLASLRIPDSVEKNPDAGKGWRTVAVVVVILVAIGAFLAYFVGGLKAQLTSPEVEVTEVRLVSPAQSSVQVTSTGFVVAQVASKVGAKVLGRVADVKIREGASVKAGDVIVKLDDAEQLAAIASARARALASKARASQARATLAETKRQYDREKLLAEQGASARSVVEDLEAKAGSLSESAKAAEADVDAAQAEVHALEVNLQYTTIKAPIDGVVLGKPVEVGELVGPGTPPVAELADFASLQVETDVPEGRLHLVDKGSPAEVVLDAYPSKRHRGEVAEISPRVNRAKATVVVKVKFLDAAEGVLPDMAARVSFLNAPLDAEAMKEPPKTVVPASAIAERGGSKVVFRIEDGRARMVPVSLGAPVGNGFEVVQGPKEGARLVANPSSKLADGDTIKEKSK